MYVWFLWIRATSQEHLCLAWLIPQWKWNALWKLVNTGLDVVTCGVANATGFGPLATNFSRLVASLATAVSSYHFIFIYFFHFLRSMAKWMNVNNNIVKLEECTDNLISYHFRLQCCLNRLLIQLCICRSFFMNKIRVFFFIGKIV